MRGTRRITSFPGCPWRSIGAPVITTRCAHCAIPRHCSGPAIRKGSARSILPWTGGNSAQNQPHRPLNQPQEISYARRHRADRAFAMPLTSPAYPIGPYRFRNREYLIITYRTDPHKLRELVPEPLQVREPLVKFEFIRMPDSTGFGDYTESGQVIPVSFRGPQGQLHPLHVSQRPPAHCRRTRAVGLSEEACKPHAPHGDRHLGGHARLRPGPRCDRHHGLQAQSRRSCIA